LASDRIAVIIPALNEALRIRDVVEGALRHCPNVILIDDGSDEELAEDERAAAAGDSAEPQTIATE